MKLKKNFILCIKCLGFLSGNYPSENRLFRNKKLYLHIIQGFNSKSDGRYLT